MWGVPDAVRDCPGASLQPVKKVAAVQNDREKKSVVLVAYGSKHGSTREVAESIAGTLHEQGLDVTLEAAATESPRRSATSPSTGKRAAFCGSC